ncbi:outer membrane protein assembly factor BamD [Buchnera aphidicola]|uniref:outer membrane protein assembly factor BamD n=1 Tax=Buchnera aphidicola TaxID=9 RepID=UPI003BEF2EF0
MKKIKNIIFITIIIFFSFTLQCQPLHKNNFINIHALYIQAQNKLKNQKFIDAITILKNINKINVMKFDNDKIQMNLIYAYYKNSNFYKAQEKIKIFKKLYPQHKNIDYILYIESLIYIKLDQNIYFKYIPIKYYQQDPIYAMKAFFQLKNIIFNYPNSVYLINIKKDIACVKNRLAMHYFQILKYYFLKKEYISVINRGDDIIKKYPDTLIIQKTLLLMEKSYRILHIIKTANTISNIIKSNPI